MLSRSTVLHANEEPRPWNAESIPGVILLAPQSLSNYDTKNICLSVCLSVCLFHISTTVHAIYFTVARFVAEDQVQEVQ